MRGDLRAYLKLIGASGLANKTIRRKGKVKKLNKYFKLIALDEMLLKYGYIKEQVHKRKHHPEKARKKMSEANKGEKSIRWFGGISCEPYGPEFNKQLKEFIRKRDNYQCQECGVKENERAHDCHHIDYKKKNSNPENLIALCFPCHIRTNGNRQYWQNHFTFKIEIREKEFFERIKEGDQPIYLE